LEFNIDDRILEVYPEVKIGVLVCNNLSVEKRNSLLEEYKNKVIMEVVEKMSSEPVTQIPFIRTWRDMYRSFGTKPGDYKPSSEALLRRVLKRKSLPIINTAVDIYNTISVKHLIPMGGFDLSKVENSIALRFSKGGERFLPLGTSHPEETYRNEPVYADDIRILTRRWNYRDCDETKITSETRDLALFLDSSAEIPIRNVEEALRDLSDLLSDVCRGDYNSGITSIKNSSFPLS
jgi:DNA/RNA-binding domain of Phe-tRNA-synthetase-like protein